MSGLIQQQEPGRTKTAGLGGEQEQGFEQSFASLAYSYLKDKAPRLLPFLVGFQLLDSTEDNTRAVGIFGFQVGDQWLYAPMFFLNGDLKGHELLYMQDQDSFIPLKENWVNYIVSRRPYALGEGESEQEFRQNATSPDISRILWPPESSKSGSDAEWQKIALALGAACNGWRSRFLYGRGGAAQGQQLDKRATLASPVRTATTGLTQDLMKVAAADRGALAYLVDAYVHSPAIKAAIDRWHGGLSAIEAAIEQQRKQAASRSILDIEPTSPRRRPATKTASLLDDPTPVAPPRPALEVYTRGQIKAADARAMLDESQRETLLTEGMLVIDKRAEHELSVAYEDESETRCSLTNPTDNGVYQVFCRPDRFYRCLVLVNPQDSRTMKAGTAVVIGLESPVKNQHLVCDREKVWVASQESDAELRDAIDPMTTGDDWSPDTGSTYVAFSPDGHQGLMPFTVNRTANGEYSANFRHYHPPESDARGTRGVDKSIANDGKCPYESFEYSTPNLVINDRPGATLTSVGGRLYVPAGWYFLKLDGRDDYEFGPPAILDDEEDPEPRHKLELADQGDVYELIMQKTARLKLAGDPHEVTITSPSRGHERMTWFNGMVSLIRDHGLPEKQARAIAKKAQASGGRSYRIKYGQGYPTARTAGEGPLAPAIPPEEMGAAQIGYGAVPATFSQEHHLPVPGLDASQTDPSIYDPFITAEPQSLQVAEQAAQEGQQEVFDTSMLSGMLKSVRQDSMIEQHLGDLMKAVDRLGRLLFLAYWHRDDFEERYGRHDMQELEDSIRNSLESLGDLVLFLKEKEVEPGPGQGMDEPSIVDIADE